MSALGKLVPLVLLFAFVGFFGWVGYQMYIFSNHLADRGKRHMEKRNVSFSRGGMKVGVKDLKEEDYADKQQNVLVKTWNLSNKAGDLPGAEGVDAAGRPKASSRTSSSMSSKAKAK